jgi:hypothetical protein
LGVFIAGLMVFLFAIYFVAAVSQGLRKVRS